MKIIIKILVILAMAQTMCFAEIGSCKEEPYDAQTFVSLLQTNKQAMLTKYGQQRVFVRGIVTKINHPTWHTTIYTPVAFAILDTTPKIDVEVLTVGYENQISYFGTFIPYSVIPSKTRITNNELLVKPNDGKDWLPMFKVGDNVLAESMLKVSPSGKVYLAMVVVRHGNTSIYYPVPK